jgi:hypothetical protein
VQTDMGGTQGNSARCPLLCTVFDRAPLTPSRPVYIVDFLAPFG